MTLVVRAGGEIIEIIEPVAPSEIVKHDGSVDRFGIARIGFEVDEIEAMVDDLKGKSVDFVGDIVEIREGHYSGGKVVFFRDPDGILLEFQQPDVAGRVT